MAVGAAARTLREGLLPPTRTNSKQQQQNFIFVVVRFLAMKPKTHFLTYKTAKYSTKALCPRSIQTPVVVAVKRVLTLEPTGHPFSYLAGFRGPCTLPQHYRLK